MRNKNGPKKTFFVSVGSMMTASHHTSADTKYGRQRLKNSCRDCSPTWSDTSNDIKSQQH